MSDLNSNTKQLFLLPKSSTKKTLVLDLDETLVHSQFLPFSIQSDVILKIDIENQTHDIHVLIRPGVQTFLQRLSKLYEIVIFTASVSKYADPLLDILDKENYCSFRLFREHCTLMGMTYIKDLNKLGRDLKDVIIVDNSPLSYSFNKENGIPILTWFSDKNDKELDYLLPILEFLSGVNDVRNYIKDIVINDMINYVNAINIIQNYAEMNKSKQCQKYIDEIIANLNKYEEQENVKNENSINNNEIKDNTNTNNNQNSNGYINITISNNEINNYLYFSPIYTINNIKNPNAINNCVDDLDIKINNDYDKTENIKKNPKEIKRKKIELNSKTNRPKSKEVFNKIGHKKKKIKSKETIRQIKLIAKNNVQKSIKINNATNKSINALYLNNSDFKDHTLNTNISDLKTLVSNKKNKKQKNFRLPKTPEIEQILYNTNSNTKKSINDLIINRIIYQTNYNHKYEQSNSHHYRNSINKLKHKIYLNINHEKHKSFNFTDLNFETNLLTFKKNNMNNTNLFYETKTNTLEKTSSHSKHKFFNTIKPNKTINNENAKLKNSLNNFHKKTLSNQLNIKGITELDKANKIKKIMNYDLQIRNSNSKRNTRIKKINTINITRTINDNNMCNYSLKKFYNLNSNTSKRSNQLNNKKIYNIIFTNKIRKFVTNIQDFTDYSTTLRHKKTLSLNGDIFPMNFLNRTNSSSISKRIINDKSNNFNNINKNKNTIKAIKINVNDTKKKKVNKIKHIKEIKFVNINDNPKSENNKTEINNNIILNKLFDNSNKFKKSLKINDIIKKSK